MNNWLVPHENNGWKPKYLQHDFLTTLIAVLLVVNLVFRFGIKNFPINILGVSVDISVETLLNYTNAERLRYGLAPLALNQKLMVAAGEKAGDIFTKNYWAHFAPDGTSPWYFFQKNNYNYIYAGENLAKDFSSSQDVVVAWMNSETHRENILKPEYKDIGFAVMEGNLLGQPTVLIVQFFGSEEVALAENKPPDNPAPVTALESSPPEPTLTPAEPTPAQAAVLAEGRPGKPQTVLSARGTDTVSKKPLVNVIGFQKQLIIAVLTVLIMALALDFYMIEKRKIFRLSGKHVAHLLFTLMLILSIITTNPGSIL